MSLMNETIKSILTDVERFLQALKKENICKPLKEERQSILDTILKLWKDYPPLAPVDGGAINLDRNATKLEKLGSLEEDVDKTDESSRTGGSSNADDGEDPYTDSSISEVAAGDLGEACVCGMLEKKQRKGTFFAAKLQKRWCVIKAGVFYYYESKKDKKQKGAFQLAGYTFRNSPELSKEYSKQKELCFELVCPAKRTYHFVTSSMEDYNKWKKGLQAQAEDAVSDIEEDIYEPIDTPEMEEFSKQYQREEESNQDNTDSQEPEPIEEDIYDEGLSAQTQDQESDGEEYADTALPSSHKSAPPPPPKGRSLPELPPTPPMPRSQPPVPPLKSNKPSETLPKITIVNPAEDFENMYFGKWDFTGGTPEELTFKKGDKIHVISKEFDEKLWWVGKINNQYGLVPKKHLMPAFEVAPIAT